MIPSEDLRAVGSIFEGFALILGGVQGSKPPKIGCYNQNVPTRYKMFFAGSLDEKDSLDPNFSFDPLDLAIVLPAWSGIWTESNL
jgi:hypothetical protein